MAVFDNDPVENHKAEIIRFSLCISLSVAGGLVSSGCVSPDISNTVDPGFLSWSGVSAGVCPSA